LQFVAFGSLTVLSAGSSQKVKWRVNKNHERFKELKYVVTIECTGVYTLIVVHFKTMKRVVEHVACIEKRNACSVLVGNPKRT
jgi:hypothetical protein